MSDASPIYGQAPSGVQKAVQVDAAGNLITSSTSVPPQSTTSTLTSVNAAASSTQLLASNANRKCAYFYNDSSAVLYLAYAAAASTSAYTVQIPANSFFEMPIPTYTGAIFGIWSAASGAVRITELT